jgi:hypothetical protein
MVAGCEGSSAAVTSYLLEAGSAYIWSLFYDIDCPHRPTQVFSTHFVLTRAHLRRTSRSVGPSTLNFRVLWRLASGKEVTTCWYEYPINPVKSWARMLHHHPLKRPTSSSINSKPGTSSLGHVRVSCAMMCDHFGSTPAMCTMPAQLRHTRP